MDKSRQQNAARCRSKSPPVRGCLAWLPTGVALSLVILASNPLASAAPASLTTSAIYRSKQQVELVGAARVETAQSNASEAADRDKKVAAVDSYLRHIYFLSPAHLFDLFRAPRLLRNERGPERWVVHAEFAP